MSQTAAVKKEMIFTPFFHRYLTASEVNANLWWIMKHLERSTLFLRFVCLKILLQTCPKAHKKILCYD